MNSGEVNKILGGVLGALLFFLLLSWFARMLYVGAEGGHEEEDRQLAFAVEVEETGGGETAEAGPDWSALLASADADAGASIFNKCKACHSVAAGENKVGPTLHGVVGRDIASVEGFDFSPALQQLDGNWDLEPLFGFLGDPGGYAPGTKMGFAGIKDEQDLVNIIAWLNQQSDAPVELTPPAGAEQAAAEGEAASAEAEAASAEGQAAEGEAGSEGQAAEGEAAGTEGEAASAEAQAAEGEAASAEGQAAEGEAGSDAQAAENESAGAEAQAAGDAAAGTEGQAAEGEAGSDAQAAENEATGDASATGTETAGAEGASGLMASADPENGEKVFRKCRACHKLEQGQNVVGPYLYGVVGRAIAAAEGYKYSDALSAKQGDWTPENLDAFLTDPRGWAEGTKMAFAGLKEEQDRIDVIAFLNQHGDAPMQFDAAPAGAGAEAVEPGAKAQATPEQVDQPEVETEAEVVKNPPTTAVLEGVTVEEEAQAEQPAEAEHPAEAEQPAEGEQQAEGEQPAEGEPAAEAEAPEGEEAADAASGAGGAFAELLAKADAEKGEKVFRKCTACHALEEGQNRVGPSLYGVVGSDIASVEGFKYSDALTSKDGTWTLEHLDAFLADPRGWAKGTRMSFPGIKDEQDRIDVITYLNEADGSPEPLGQ